MHFEEGASFAVPPEIFEVQNLVRWKAVCGDNFALFLLEVVSGAGAPKGAEVWVAAGRDPVAFLPDILWDVVVFRPSVGALVRTGTRAVEIEQVLVDAADRAWTCSGLQNFVLSRDRFVGGVLQCLTAFH